MPVVDFGMDPPIQALLETGGEVERVEGQTVVLRVSGELGPLLTLLAQSPIRHLSFPEPTLEEAFNKFYQDENSGSGGDR